MNGTWAVIRQGERRGHSGFSKEEAEKYAAELPRLLNDPDGPPFTAVDLLPDLEQRFPLGGQVWLGKPAHWRLGQHGVVAAGELEDFAEWPESGPSPWQVCLDGALVYVVLDDGYETWWPATWLETR